MSIKPSVTVAVSGLNNIDSPGPGIPVIRALKESNFFNVRIIGLSYETLEPGLYMRDLVDKSYQLPLPSAGIAVLLDRLHYIHQQENIQVIIPNFDSELYNFIKIADQLKSEMGILTVLPTLNQFESRQKSVLNDFGKKNDVKVPFSKTIFSVNELLTIEEEFNYPLVIKGKYYDAAVVANFSQASHYFHKISNQWGLPIVVQEFVTGTEVNVTAIGDGEGNCIGAVPMRKLYITDKGKAWAGVSLDDAQLIAITNQIISKSKWKGGCELEFIRSNDGYYLLEMNPRFPAWVYLAVACGQNHPEALLKMALGYPVKPFQRYDTGKLFIRYSYDQIVDMQQFETISTKGEL